MIRRGEIYFVALDPTLGREIKKTRPALVISNDQSNQYSSLVTLAPITSNVNKIYPWEVFLKPKSAGLKEKGKVKINQIRSVDKQRLISGPLGPPLDSSLMEQIEVGIKIHLALK